MPDSFEDWVASFFQFDPEKKGVIPKSPSAFKDWLVNVASKQLENMVKPHSDFALLMGGGDLLKDVFYAITASLIPETGKALTDKLFDGAIEFDTITHNRLVVPVDKPFLAFDILAPILFTDNGQIEVQFNAVGVDPTPIKVALDRTGFLQDHTYWMEVPDSWKGHVGTLSLTKSKDLNKIGTFLQFSMDDQSSFDPLGSVSQLMFIDDIRFTDSYIKVDLSANSVREELDSVTATLTVVGPVDATKPTVVTIDWADGIGTIQAATIPAGQTTTTFTHTYKDDDPTLTPSDKLKIVVTSTNTVAGGAADITVHNVVPTITELALDTYEIDEGDEISLQRGLHRRQCRGQLQRHHRLGRRQHADDAVHRTRRRARDHRRAAHLPRRPSEHRYAAGHADDQADGRGRRHRQDREDGAAGHQQRRARVRRAAPGQDRDRRRRQGGADRQLHRPRRRRHLHHRRRLGRRTRQDLPARRRGQLRRHDRQLPHRTRDRGRRPAPARPATTCASRSRCATTTPAPTRTRST